MSSRTDKGLSNKHLKVAAVPWRPFLLWKCPNDTKWDDKFLEETDCPNDIIYSGILWDLLMFIKQAKNVSFTLLGRVDDAYWAGTCNNGDNCTGMIGMVSRHEADFALGL